MALLDAIEALRGKPVTELNEKEWDATLGLGGIHRYKDQLSMHLEQCTKGNARRIVATCGERNALDAWRQLADRGCPMRLQNVHSFLKKAMYHKKDVNNKDLEASIADWERDLEIHARATGEDATTKSTQRMLLLERCSPALRTHLRMREHLIPDLPAMRQETNGRRHTFGQTNTVDGYAATPSEGRERSPLTRMKKCLLPNLRPRRHLHLRRRHLLNRRRPRLLPQGQGPPAAAGTSASRSAPPSRPPACQRRGAHKQQGQKLPQSLLLH